MLVKHVVVLQIRLNLRVIVLEGLIELFSLVFSIHIFRTIFLNQIPSYFIEALRVGGWGVVCHISMVLESGISLELVFMVFVFRIYGLVSYVFFVIIAKFCVLKC